MAGSTEPPQRLAPPQELYPDSSDTTTATNDVILRLETPGLRALLLGVADDLALDALAGSGQSLAADVVAVAMPPGTPIDPQGPLGTVLAMAHPRLIVVTNTPGGTGRRRRYATPARSRPTTRRRPTR